MSTSNVELTQLAYRLGWTLVHSLWQGAAVAMVLGIALTILRRRSAQARYLASLGALALVVAAAAVTFGIVGSTFDAGSPGATSHAPTAAPGLSPLLASRTGPSEPIVITPPGTNRPPGHETRTAAMPTPHRHPLLERATARLEPMLPWLTIAWAVGVLAMSFWHAGGWVAAQRLRILGVRPPDDHVIALARHVAGRLGLRAPVRVVVSMLAHTPMVIGWLRPVVLLPAAIVTGFTPAQLEGILAHELAHIRRHDYLVNLFQVLAETLLFYHPAVWWISRRVRLEREQCCDEIAVEACADRCAYAESLAALEEVRLNAGLALAAGGSGGKELLARIRRILGRDDEPPTHTGRLAVAALMILVAAAVPLSLLNAALATPPASAHPPAAAATQPAPATQPSSPRPTILLVTPGNYFLERALDHLGWRLVIVTPREFRSLYLKAHPLAGVVTVFDRWAPKAATAGPAMYVDAIPPDSGLRVDQDAAGHPVEIKEGHELDWFQYDPILKGTQFDHSVFVAEALKLHVPADWRTLASNADGTVIVAHSAGGTRQIVIGFDVQQSNWPVQISFPLFMHRAVQWLMKDAPAPADASTTAHAAADAAGPATRPSPAPRLQFRVEARPDGGDGETDELKEPASGKSYRFRKRAVLTEADVKAAHRERMPNGELAVDVEFTDAGAAKLLKVTSDNLNRRMAILFDGRVLSMPVMRAAISRAAMITGGFNGMTPQEAQALVEAIGSAHPPAASATGPTTAPATRQAAAFTADCVLSGIVDGKRKVLATPTLNIENGTKIQFVYTGKPPVVIERQPGQEAGIAAEVQADEQPGGKVRVFCNLQQREAANTGLMKTYGDVATLLSVHQQNLMNLERKLNEAKQLLNDARRDLDRRRIGLSGFRPYSIDEICRVDPTLLAKVNALNEQHTNYDYLLTKYGRNYPSTKEAMQLLQIRQDDIERSVKRFNDEFFIQERSDGGPARPISKDLSKLQAVVDNYQKQYDDELAAVKHMTRSRGVGVETDQIVRLGEPVAIELADGTRLEVAIRTATNP